MLYQTRDGHLFFGLGKKWNAQYSCSSQCHTALKVGHSTDSPSLVTELSEGEAPVNPSYSFIKGFVSAHDLLRHPNVRSKFFVGHIPGLETIDPPLLSRIDIDGEYATIAIGGV